MVIHLHQQLWSLVLGLLLVRDGRGYPGGAPDMACQSMLPTGHGTAPQASDPPYSIFVPKKSYKPGETLQIIVQAEGDDYFRGLFLQARMTGCNVNETKTIGVFTNTDRELVTRHCFGEVHSAVSHNSATKKRLKTFYWTAPVVSSGHVVMRATIVRELQEYWTEVESHVVADLHTDVSTKCIPTLPGPTTRRTRPSHGITLDQQSLGTSTSRDSQQWTSQVTDTTVKRSDGTTKRREETTERQAVTNSRDENLPSWLNPSFNKESPDTFGESGQADNPSWLIPAYQKASSSSSSSSFVRDWHDGGRVVLVASLLWTVFVLL